MHVREGRALLALVLALGLLVSLTGVRNPARAQEQPGANRAFSFSTIDFNNLITSTVQIIACDKARPSVMPTIDMTTFKRTCSAGWIGSGTIIRSDGTILTNAHVALNEAQKEPVWALVLRTVDARSLPQPAYFARAVLYSPRAPMQRGFTSSSSLDLAVIVPAFTLDGTPIAPGSIVVRPLPMAEPGAVDIGDELRNIGYPGMGGELITITQGNVSGFETDPNAKELGNAGWIKTDATLGGGISGGTSINEEGLLIGVPTELGGTDVRPVENADQSGTIQSVIGQLNHLRPIPEGFTLLQDVGLGDGLPAPEQPDTPSSGPNAATADEVILTGSIVSADSDQRIPGAWFIVLEPGVRTEDYLNGQQDVVYSFASSGSDGTFQLRKPVTRGQAYGVVVIARGFTTINDDDQVLAGADAPVVASLPPVRMATQR
jgi:S1-C subfamily serine protease